MDTPKFRQLLLNIVGPKLEEHGYVFHQDRGKGRIIYEFHKTLQDPTRCAILFQRQQVNERPAGNGFTIDLMRGNAEDVVHGKQSPNGLNLRLGQVLWYVYGLHIYDKPDHWWTSTTPSQFDIQLQDALNMLERYGIPWLENPQSRNPWLIPAQARSEFEGAVRRLVQPAMEKIGYTFHNEFPTNTIFFTKALPAGLNAFVRFDQKYFLDPPRQKFDVHLIRQATEFPDQFTDVRRDESLRVTLELLIWVRTGIRFNSSKAINSEYSNLTQLMKRLEETIQLIKQYAIPWLEDPASRNPQSFRGPQI